MQNDNILSLSSLFWNVCPFHVWLTMLCVYFVVGKRVNGERCFCGVHSCANEIYFDFSSSLPLPPHHNRHFLNIRPYTRFQKWKKVCVPLASASSDVKSSSIEWVHKRWNNTAAESSSSKILVTMMVFIWRKNISCRLDDGLRQLYICRHNF